MMSLQGARVLLVDDNLKEALPVIKAFAKKGIPVVYFDGSLADLPAENEKLQGVRLALLDMDLIGGGDHNENKISTLIARMQALLAVDNGPYTLIAWTKHSELVNLLEEKLFALFQTNNFQEKVPLPLICIRLEKKDFGNENDGFDIDKLAMTINTEINKSLPWIIMQFWEAKCMRAASGVTNKIADMLTTSNDSLNTMRETWNQGYLDILVALAKEDVGKDNLNATIFFNALFGALNPLHVDLLETNQLPFPELEDKFITDRAEKSKEPLAGKINTQIHFSFENPDVFAPGNIYNFTECGDVFTVQPRQIFDDMLRPGLSDNEKDELFLLVTPILLEVSASCDFAQNKIKLGKFLAGLKIPETQYKKFNPPGGAFLLLNPLYIENTNCGILLNSQYLITLEVGEARKLKASARLRSQWLLNVQFWLGQQLSRPGVIKLM